MDDLSANIRPILFAPAGNSGKSALEFIDLDDVFADDIDYSQFFAQFDDEGGKGLRDESGVSPSIFLDDGRADAGLMSMASVGVARAVGGRLVPSGVDPTKMNAAAPRGIGEREGTLLIPPSMPISNQALAMRASTRSGAKSGPSHGGKAGGGGGDSGDDVDDDDDDDGDDGGDGDQAGGTRKTKRPRKAMQQSALDSFVPTEKQRVERRERNREHAKRSRIRKRVMLDLLQDQLTALRRENVSLRRVVTEHIPEKAVAILDSCTTLESELLESVSENHLGMQVGAGAGGSASAAAAAAMYAAAAGAGGSSLSFPAAAAAAASASAATPATCVLMEPDYRLIQALVTSQQNFVISDPSLADNPIVYCSDGFCKLSGYKRSEIIGRNCRFLQGPGTDLAAVDLIRTGVAEGRDMSVCLLNYKANGKPFWNQFFVAAIRDDKGAVVNFVGVQCEVNLPALAQIKARVKRLPV